MADNLILWAKDQMKKTPEVHMAFPIQEVINDVYSVMRDAAEQKQITLSAETESTLEVYGNRQQVEFIIRNLVNNAIKYTPRSGKVAMGVRSDGLNRVKVFVTDTGMGMDAATLEGLFELNGDKSRLGTNGEKGSGLGLTLSHEFARRNNGAIEVESTPQQGTSFYVIMQIGSRAA